MPNWEGIEDASPTVPRIWLSRDKESDPWAPLRKSDCISINNNPGDEILVECGRATANTTTLTLSYNFINFPSRHLRGSTWFLVTDPNYKKNASPNKNSSLEPLSAADNEAVESLYQKTLTEGGSFGKGFHSMKNEEVILEDGKHRAVVSFIGTTISLRHKVLSQPGILGFGGNGGTGMLLQRGYGEYTVLGEEDEVALGPVGHLVFVVHGIGEAMWSKADVAVPSLVDEMNRMRRDMNGKKVEMWRRECERAEKEDLPLPPPPPRTEVLPIEWYDRIHSNTSQLMKSLTSTTIKTIPALRAIANDVVFDILMYLTPKFCQATIECVTRQINDLYVKFTVVHEDFLGSGGKCSLVGHSLGSVIVWDILSLLKDSLEREEGGDDDEGFTNNPSSSLLSVLPLCLFGDSSTTTGSDNNSNSGSSNDHAKGTWGPSLLREPRAILRFTPDYTFFLGSPLGLFLSLRGAHNCFDDLLQKQQQEQQNNKDAATTTSSSSADATTADNNNNNDNGDDGTIHVPTSPFTLPSGSVYNIFHPSDPVAYRIEPLLLPLNKNNTTRNTNDDNDNATTTSDDDDDNLPPPLLLTTSESGIRLHYKVSKFMTRVMSIGQKMDNTKKKRSYKFKLGGERTNRVDYVLQQGVIDNQYLSSVMAHSSYFTNQDLVHFFVQVTTETTTAAEKTDKGTDEDKAA